MSQLGFMRMVWYNGGMDIHTTCAFCGKDVVRRKQAASANVRLHFCDIRCKANYQRLAKPVTQEWLEEQYVKNGLDCVQIGRIVKRDPKTVWNWLRDFGIPTRPRGSNPPPHTGSGEDNPFYGKKHSPETRKLLSDMAKEDGRVPYDPEIGSYMKGRKGQDTPGWKGGITPERQALYSSVEWGDAVKVVWARADAKCERCGKSHNATARGTFHIHHIVGFANRELRAIPSNLVLLCKECHRFVHSKKNINHELIKEI